MKTLSLNTPYVRAATITVIASVLLLTGIAPIVNVAYAAKPTTVNVTWESVVTFTSSRSAGGNTLLHFTDVIILSGGAVGTTTCGVGSLKIHPDGTIDFQAKCTFTGTVTGGSGPGTMSVWFVGTSDGSSMQGMEFWGSGTEGLAGIHAEGTFVGEFTGPTTGSGTKIMQVHFDP